MTNCININRAAVVEPDGRRVHLTGQPAWDSDLSVPHDDNAREPDHPALPAETAAIAVIADQQFLALTK